MYHFDSTLDLNLTWPLSQQRDIDYTFEKAL
jgi:hypothetical protein